MTHTFFSLRWHTLIAILLVLFAFGMAAIISDRVFERLPHLEDEMAYLFQARVFARGEVVLDSPNPRRAFWIPFVIDFAPNGEDLQRFGKYTPGWPLLLALGINLGQWWVVNAFFAGLTVALVYRLGRELFNSDVGLMAAALVAFSPMALLLNATLMNHTSALFFTVLFMYAFWRLERTADQRGNARLRPAVWWGLVAGAALGMVAISRPLTAVALALPFVVRSGGWLIERVCAAYRQRREKIGGDGRFLLTLRPLLLVGLVAILISLAIPAFNRAATGDPLQNLYTLVWEYDRVGFGAGYGRNGHMLEKGLRHARFDLSLLAADLFGWQITPFSAGQGLQLAPFTPELQEHVRTNAGYFPVWGMSWLLLPFGLLVGFWGRRALLVGCWAALSGIALIRTVNAAPEILQNPSFSWTWIGVALLWINWPVLLFRSRRERWVWLLLALPLTIIVVQMMYWIGSQLYSTRYFFEALAAMALLSALPLAWLARRFARLKFAVYGGLLLALLYSLYAYSMPRIGALYGFNAINREVIEAVQARMTNGQPALVLITGPGSGDNRVRWRALAALNVVTSPYFDSPIVAAWNFGDETTRQQILDLFPGRQLIEMRAQRDRAWFIDVDG
ncbi:MAG: glycosyltransferase family 39 protein [Chloroflexi bacterium]|nr:glycosyltransferase family 39 protein [Chloroflexota bacterium]